MPTHLYTNGKICQPILPDKRKTILEKKFFANGQKIDVWNDFVAKNVLTRHHHCHCVPHLKFPVKQGGITAAETKNADLALPSISFN